MSSIMLFDIGMISSMIITFNVYVNKICMVPILYIIGRYDMYDKNECYLICSYTNTIPRLDSPYDTICWTIEYQLLYKEY